jgi:hypothetical protein
MWKETWVIGVTMILSLLLSGPEIWACPAAGPNGHIGDVVKVDPSTQTIQIRDGQTGEPLTFQAAKEQLSGIAPKDQILIRYKMEGGKLIAEQIKKLP